MFLEWCVWNRKDWNYIAISKLSHNYPETIGKKVSKENNISDTFGGHLSKGEVLLVVRDPWERLLSAYRWIEMLFSSKFLASLETMPCLDFQGQAGSCEERSPGILHLLFFRSHVMVDHQLPIPRSGSLSWVLREADGFKIQTGGHTKIWRSCLQVLVQHFSPLNIQLVCCWSVWCNKLQKSSSIQYFICKKIRLKHRYC